MARLLYFAGLVDTLGRTAEDIAVADDVRVTGNKQFVNLDVPVAVADGIALVATRP